MFDLKFVKNEKLIYSRLQSAKLKKLDIVLWRFVGAKKVTVKATIEIVKRDKLEFSITPQLGEDLNLVNIITGQKHIDIYIPDLVLLFRASLKTSQSPKRYIFTIPDHVYLSERRKTPRIRIGHLDNIKFRLKKGLTSERVALFKKCDDLSERGFSYVISKSEAKLLQDQVGLISKYEFKIDDKCYQGSLKILKVQELELVDKDFGYGQYRVSCFFDSMTDDFKKELQYFIFLRLKADLDVINGV